MKVYVYKMHAGHCGTDETLTVVSESPLSPEEQEEYLSAHAEQYQEQDEYGEWSEGDPEIYLDVTYAKEDLELFKEDYEGELIGKETMEQKLEELAKEGMLWN